MPDAKIRQLETERTELQQQVVRSQQALLTASESTASRDQPEVDEPAATVDVAQEHDDNQALGSGPAEAELRAEIVQLRQRLASAQSVYV